MSPVARKLVLPSLSDLAEDVQFPPATTQAFLDLVFNITRGKVLGWLGDEGFFLAQDQSPAGPAGNALRLAFPWPAPAPEFPEIEIISGHENVELVKVIVRDEQRHAKLVYGPNACGLGYQAYLPGTGDWELVSSSITAASYISALDTALGYPAAPADDTIQRQRFFAQFDRQTNGQLIDELVNMGALNTYQADMRKLRINSVFNQLRFRVEQRAKAWRPDLVAADALLPVDDQASWEPKLDKTSTLLLDVIDSHFDTVEAFADAFVPFANGELRLHLPTLAWTTQPSSGYFYLFAEFALMACDYGVHRARWEPLANAMVRAQPIFCRVYGPPDKAGANFMSYGAWNYACNGQPYDQPEKDAVKSDFETATYPDLCLAAAKHAADFMPGLI